MVRQLRSADNGYEIDLWTSEPFVVRATAAILRFGNVETALSNFEDGALDKVTFYLTAEDFNHTSTGDPMVVHYGFVPQELERNPDLGLAADIANRGNVWTFGPLDKSQLNCPPLPAPGTG